jgi:hypothetical protein
MGRNRTLWLFVSLRAVSSKNSICRLRCYDSTSQLSLLLSPLACACSEQDEDDTTTTEQQQQQGGFSAVPGWPSNYERVPLSEALEYKW